MYGTFFKNITNSLPIWVFYGNLHHLCPALYSKYDINDMAIPSLWCRIENSVHLEEYFWALGSNRKKIHDNINRYNLSRNTIFDNQIRFYKNSKWRKLQRRIQPHVKPSWINAWIWWNHAFQRILASSLIKSHIH